MRASSQNQPNELKVIKFGFMPKIRVVSDSLDSVDLSNRSHFSQIDLDNDEEVK